MTMTLVFAQKSSASSPEAIAESGYTTERLEAKWIRQALKRRRAMQSRHLPVTISITGA